MPRRKPPDQPPGRQGSPEEATPPDVGCFVAGASHGQYWSGNDWVERWQDAEQFAYPLPDPWLSCREVCDAVAAREGIDVAPCYIPPADARRL
jgi:hypothetical protein